MLVKIVIRQKNPRIIVHTVKNPRISCVIVLCNVLLCVDQGGLDPVRGSHQVLDALVHDLLVGFVEEALVECFDGVVMLLLSLVVLALLIVVLRALGLGTPPPWIGGFCVPEARRLP